MGQDRGGPGDVRPLKNHLWVLKEVAMKRLDSDIFPALTALVTLNKLTSLQDSHIENEVNAYLLELL